MDDSPHFSDRLLLALLAAVMCASAGWWAFNAFPRRSAAPTPPAAAPVREPLSDVALTDEHGAPFSPVMLKGRPWIAGFIFTSCAGECPLITSRMKELQQALPAEIHFVSFTIDPQRDTPQRLAEYGKANGAESGRWHFVTGETAALAKLSREGFGLAFSGIEAPEGTLTHSLRLSLVDRSGAVRGTYDSSDPEAMRRLAGDARRL
jgi:protein SCO1/2